MRTDKEIIFEDGNGKIVGRYVAVDMETCDLCTKCFHTHIDPLPDSLKESAA